MNKRHGPLHWLCRFLFSAKYIVLFWVEFDGKSGYNKGEGS